MTFPIALVENPYFLDCAIDSMKNSAIRSHSASNSPRSRVQFSLENKKRVIQSAPVPRMVGSSRQKFAGTRRVAIADAHALLAGPSPVPVGNNC